MKLYSWIENEKHIGKTQGGNKCLRFTIDYEEKGQDWRCNPDSHKLQINVFFPDDNPDTKPNVFIGGSKDFNVIDHRKDW